MRVSKYVHACLLVVDGGDRILFDPGKLSFVEGLVEPDAFTDFDAYRGIELLALPVMAPWTTELEVAKFARRISPRRIIPIHDGYAKDFFLKQRYENFQKYFAELGIKFHPLGRPGESIEV